MHRNNGFSWLKHDFDPFYLKKVKSESIFSPNLKG